MSGLFVCIGLLLSPLAQAGGDAETISRHRGKKGGVVVLWPRVVPAESDSAIDTLAGELQQHLGQVALRVSDSAALVTRPAPERVCPQAGCKAVSLGVVLGHHEGGCFAVGLVGAPNGGEVRMVPWAGEVLSARRAVPHRKAPENELVVTEFVPCDLLLSSLDDGPLERALAETLAGDPPPEQ